MSLQPQEADTVLLGAPGHAFIEGGKSFSMPVNFLIHSVFLSFSTSETVVGIK
jgi:hypothetical protein